VRDPGVPARLQTALEAQVAAGAPGALARIEALQAALTWGGSAGYLARGGSRALRPGDAFRAASVTKSVTAAVAPKVARRLVEPDPL
jgi:D-alanyl-D-alanine carboxypeptidase